MLHIFMKQVKYCVKTNVLFMKQTLNFCLGKLWNIWNYGVSDETAEISWQGPPKKPNVAVL